MGRYRKSDRWDTETINFAEIALSSFVLSVIIIAIISGIISTRKEGQIREMDLRQSRCDTPEAIVLIDTQRKMVGVYAGYKPLMHTWNAQTRLIQTGLFYAQRYGSRLELCREDTDVVQVLQLSEYELTVFTRFVPNNTPVLVY